MKTKKNYIKIIIAGILIILLFLICIGISSSVLKHIRCYIYRNELNTYLKITTLEYIIQLYKDKDGKLPWSGKDKKGLQDFDKLKKILCAKEEREDSIPPLKWRKQFFCNLNNKKFHVYFNTNDNEMIQIRNVTITNSIAIWSSGENKSNEFGKGDDIVSWENAWENINRIKIYKRKKWLKFFGFK